MVVPLNATTSVLYFDRGLMDFSLSFHIVLASLAMALPLIMVAAEYLYLRKKDNDYYVLARRMSKVFLLFFAIGTASGILVSINILVLWPKFMSLVSQVAILPFSLETDAFFAESLFVAVYFFSWKKLKDRYLHVVLGIPIVIGGALSAVFITLANAFMNTPNGFDIPQYLATGAITDVHPWAVFFSSSAATEVSHVLASTYFMGVFIAIAYFAIMLLFKRTDQEKRYYRKALWLLIVLAVVFTLWSLASGSVSASNLVVNQPEKFAAIEGTFKPIAYAPEKVGGIPGPNYTLIDYVEIPDLQSILATGSPSGMVPGLDSYPQSTWPPLFVHILFDIMVIGGTSVAFVLAIIVLTKLLKRDPISNKIILVLLAICGAFSIVLVEVGWAMAESARQPWIIYNVMTVAQAANYSPSVMGVGTAIFAFYIAVIPVSILILRIMFKKHPLSGEITK